MQRIWGGRAAGIAAAIALIASAIGFAAATASAAEVTVTVTRGTPNAEVLAFVAAPGEDNDVEIVNLPGSPDRLRILDSGAPLQAGPGCTVEPASDAVVCDWAPPRASEWDSCGKNCVQPVPESGWKGRFEIALADGQNRFDAGSLTGIGDKSVVMSVTSGSGADRIVTGGGEDLIDPGPGSDLVKAGDGYNTFVATAMPDGPDTYESLGYSQLSYAQRADPVELAGSTAGAPGEGDVLIGVRELIGGAGDDRLTGGDVSFLDGGPGDDRIVSLHGTGSFNNASLYGGTGDDYLRAYGNGLNRLVGEAGDDVSHGGPGTDIILDREIRFTAGPKMETIPTTEGGDDVGYGGDGGDSIGLGRGVDRAFGGGGADRLAGESGSDLLNGGPGPDRLVGGPGQDDLRGGGGSDVLFSGRWKWVPAKEDFPFAKAPNDGPDRDDCGSGRDTVIANPWDGLQRCERVRILRPSAS